MPPLVIPHDPQWKELFDQEQADLREALGDQAITIHHIGSTLIPNILAKPVIDILIEVSSLESLDRQSPQIEALGYESMGAFGIEGRRFFRKDNAQGERTHHIHAFESGSAHLDRHLAFRDYLIAHPIKAQEYSKLKADLTMGENTAMETYVDGKALFIKETQAQAVKWFRGKR